MYLELWTFQLTASRGGWRNFCPTLPATPTYFNSQPHEEADLSPHSIEIPCRYFNSQPHEEADDSTIMRCTPFCYFNSQPHEEADGHWLVSQENITISTHSLTRRLTAVHQRHNVGFWFQLTASRGGWQDQKRTFQLSGKHFNSQPHEEADGVDVVSFQVRLYFNSQPHEEADKNPPKKMKYSGNFNSQPHEEADSNFKQKSFYLKLFFIFIA